MHILSFVYACNMTCASIVYVPRRLACCEVFPTRDYKTPLITEGRSQLGFCAIHVRRLATNWHLDASTLMSRRVTGTNKSVNLEEEFTCQRFPRTHTVQPEVFHFCNCRTPICRKSSLALRSHFLFSILRLTEVHIFAIK